MGTHEQLAYSLTEAAQVLKMSRATLYRRIKDGTIRTVTIGHKPLVTHAELVRVLGIDGEE